MYAVAADTMTVFNGLRETLRVGCTTYLPYSALTITVMLMALTQHAHGNCSVLLRTTDTPDNVMDCFGVVYTGGSDGYHVAGLGLLPRDTLQAVMEAVQRIRAHLCQAVTDGELKHVRSRGAELTDLVWQLILLTSAAEVALDQCDVSELGTWSERELEKTEDWVAENAWSSVQIGRQIGMMDSMAYLGPKLKVKNEAHQRITDDVIVGELLYELEATSPVSHAAVRLKQCALHLLRWSEKYL